MRLLGLRSGVGRAIEAILRELDNIDHPFSEIRVYSPEPISEAVYMPRKCFNVVLRSPLPKGLWEQFILPIAHGRKGPLFCPSYVAPVISAAPVVLTHHGSYEAYPEAFPWFARTKSKIILKLSARSADFISTVSAQSRKDIETYYGIPQSDVRVIPEGVDTTVFKPISDQRAKKKWRRKWIGSDAPYILYVGKATKRRNLGQVIEAFRRLRIDHGWTHKLVFLGTKLPGDALNEINAKDDGVIMIDYADHGDVTFAYNCADIFIYPSSYEGFGMPVLEAMACGTPTIALNNTAFPEFAGGIAWLLEDAAPETLADALLRLAADDDAKRRMRHDGPVRAAKYDWKRVVPQYVNLLCEASGLAPVSEIYSWSRAANAGPDTNEGRVS